ncbi:S41 family peptidase [Bernardetia sp. OM2101]|uniref:S41 family peptidase n=1 Tax=Bernardetia sp. OM2101 TaxID=3344876 RepID=UPI0035CFCD2F
MIKIILFIFISILIIQSAYSQSERTIKNITAFSKAYGYVKYFHPSDEANELDWKKFSVYGVRKVEKCKNDEELVKELNRIFYFIAPTSKFILKSGKTDYDTKILIPKDTSEYKQIYWQHNGVSFNMEEEGIKDNPYKSVRINKTKNLDKSSEFGNVLTSIDPAEFKGKEIKYEGWSKLDASSEGQGQFWIRVDKSDKEIGFFDNSRNNPIKKDKWQKFELKGKIDINAKNLVFGCFLLGKGTLYVDNIKLFYKENDKWIEIPIKNSDFETEDIASDRNSSNQWKGFGTGYKIVSQDKYKISGNKSVKIEYVGSFEKEEGNNLFDCRPKFGELIESEIATNIYCQIPLVLYGNEDKTFPVSDKSEYKKQITKILNTKNSPDNLYIRIGNVINAYNLFRHFYPYFDVVQVDWEAEFVKTIKQSFLDKNGKEHLETLQKFTAKLKDGHISVESNYDEYYIPPILWEWVEDKLVITYVKNKELSIKIGDVVESINGKLPSVFFKETKEKISAATDSGLSYEANYSSLCGAKSSKIHIKVNSKQYELVRDYTYQEVVNSDDIYPLKYNFYNDSSVVYLNLDIIEIDTINYLMPILEKSKAIICDLRGYPNGNHELISHLLKENEKDSSWMQIPQIIYPNYENLCGFEKHGWLLEAKKPYLGNKQVIFITNGQAISYAESYMSFIEGYNLATIVGQTTAGTNGNVNSFELIGGYMITWTGMKVIKHNGNQHHGIGIIPNVKVEKTIKGITENRDEFLEKSLELIR